MISCNPASPWLAPLAGWSDIALRLLAREYGAAVCCTEMVSAKGIVYGGKSTEELLLTCPEDSPLVVQLFGSEPEFLVQAMQIIQERGFEYFDINMGCSVPKVTKTGAGSALLKDTDLLLRNAEAVIKQSKGKVGIKLRLGWEMHKPVWKEFLPSLCQMQPMWLTLHPRYARQLFTGKADREQLKEFKELATVPVIASGDLFTAQDGMDCLRETKVDCVMYARGAMENPSVFKDHAKLIQGIALQTQTLDDVYKMIMRYAELCQQYLPERALLKMRTFVPRILHHFSGVAHLRQAIVKVRTWNEFYEITDTYYRNYTDE